VLLWPRAFPRKHALRPFPGRIHPKGRQLTKEGAARNCLFGLFRRAATPVHLSQTMRQKRPNSTRKAPISVAILAGGLSSRMGVDKSRLRLGRRTLLGHVRTTAKQLGVPVRIIRRDVVLRCGPLGGVYTALATSRAGAELFLSCDMPFVSADLLQRLISQSDSGERAVFASGSGEASFPFLIPVSSLPIVRRQLAVRRFSLQSLARVLRARHLRAPPAELLNINTPSDLQLAGARVSVLRGIWQCLPAEGRKRRRR
jgi:molybdenum cofactor guanylyltransferase